MWLSESVSRNIATPKHADRTVENASANSTPSESPSKTAADASHQIRNPRCRASTNAVNKELNLELEERIPQMRPCHFFGYQTPIRLAIDGQAADFANSAMK